MKSSLRLALTFALLATVAAAVACTPKTTSTTSPPVATNPSAEATGSQASTAPAEATKSAEASPVAEPSKSFPATDLAGVDANIGQPAKADGWVIIVRSVGKTNSIGGKQMKAGGIMQIQVGLTNGSKTAGLITPKNFSLESVAKGAPIKPAPGPGITKKVAAGSSVTSSAFFLVPDVNGDYVLVFTAPGSSKSVRLDTRVR